jgi:anti-anti-sigma factor
MPTHLSPVSPGIYQVIGDLTFNSVNLLRKLPAPLFSGTSTPQIALNKVQHVDSAGLALLIDWCQQSLAHQTIIFTQANPQLLELVALYNLDDVIPLQQNP